MPSQSFFLHLPRQSLRLRETILNKLVPMMGKIGYNYKAKTSAVKKYIKGE